MGESSDIQSPSEPMLPDSTDRRAMVDRWLIAVERAHQRHHDAVVSDVFFFNKVPCPGC